MPLTSIQLSQMQVNMICVLHVLLSCLLVTTVTAFQPTRIRFQGYKYKSRRKLELFSSSTDTDVNVNVNALTHNGIDLAMLNVNGSSTSNGSSPQETHHESSNTVLLDVPLPTVNGGYTHTSSSRAKISAANKGKIPWNKGMARSEETRARIAAGVRAKNRMRFLETLQKLGITEEEYENQKRNERREREAERRARKTEKGGYRPTLETKQKISTVLKQKWQTGEMKKQQRRRTIHPDKIRRGFTHSPETRAKISATLKQRWAKDPDYRDNMVKKSLFSNSKLDVKQKISEALKLKWQDEEFRAYMMEKMNQSRNKTTTNQNKPHDVSHCEKISLAMKKKWQDDNYRKKTLAAMEKRRAAAAAQTKTTKTKRNKPKKTNNVTTTAAATTEIRLVQPREATRVVAQTHDQVVLSIQPPQQPKKNGKKSRKRKSKDNDIYGEKEKGDKGENVVETNKHIVDSSSSSSSRTVAEKKMMIEPSIQRLREERRDLYDLLYGEEEEEYVSGDGPADDGNLDTFDPYGLDDF